MHLKHALEHNPDKCHTCYTRAFVVQLHLHVASLDTHAMYTLDT